MNEAIVPLANAVEELLRHGHSCGESNRSTAMETDSEDKGNEEHCLVGALESATEGISDEQFLQLSILHLMVLLHRMENSETCRLFVEKSGIEALLKLLLKPSVVQSSEGMSIALHSTMVFKGFTQHHSAPLARAFCSSLRQHLKKALTGFGAASGSFLLDPLVMPDDGVFSPLFLVEFLLFLAASKDNHAKVEIEDDGASVEPELQRDSSANNNEEQRMNSFRQFLDPLLRRRTMGWSIESQFFDLINLYRDLGRATDFHQRLGIDGLNMRFGANHSTLSDASGSINNKEYDKQRGGKSDVTSFTSSDDAINASPASKSVASSFASIALDHMNFEVMLNLQVRKYSYCQVSLLSYGKLMDHLVTSSFILSPFTKHLLVQPLVSGDVPFPRDAETFVKVLQSMVLKAVLPVWANPQFTDCSYDFITTIISIIRHIYSGVEVKNVTNGSSARITGPPPNETTVATIVEMGFSRSRAEEALRQVGSNSVELAMEWLFSHPEETPEDDELARALAMSLGNSETDTNVDVTNDSSHQLEEEMAQLPPVEELLSTCTKLLQIKEPLAFPVRDLLVLIGSKNDGQYRSSIITYIIDQVRDSSSASDCRNNSRLSALFHILALILNEDVGAREIASKTGLVKIVTDLLSKWDSSLLADKEKPQQLKGDNVSIRQISVSIDDDKKSKLHSSFGSPRNIDFHEQKRLIEIACSCLRNQFPSETVHAVLQLCSTLTRTHSIAVCFLDGGGVSSILSLPTSSLFPGFDNIAATIIRHVLEDPQTLQQAMEAEIKQNLVAMANRHSNGRVSPRIFLVNLSSVISRDPVIFMQAVKSVCQVEMVVTDRKAIASQSEESEISGQDVSALLAKIVFVLKLLTEILLVYASSVHVLLRRDSEIKFNEGKEIDGDWRHKLATTASQFLVASCTTRSDIQNFVDLLNDILVARTPTGSCISAEASATFIDVAWLIKALELVNKEHVHSIDSSTIKVHGMVSQFNHDAVVADRVQSFNTVQNYGASEAVTDDMEHDQDLNGGFVPAAEDEYMQETSEDARLLKMVWDNVGIHFGIQPREEENLDDEEDEEMSGDDGDEEDDDEEDHNDLEEDGVHHLSLDTDQDDHEIDDDEFDDELLEDGDDEDDVMKRMENGRHNHRLNLWVYESQQSSGSSSATVPQGLEELLVTQLRRPVPEKSSDQNTSAVEPQTQGEDNHTLNADRRTGVSDPLQGTDASSIHFTSGEMQFEQNDAAVRDVELGSQESSGSGYFRRKP
ncbi:hypothetical protein GQ457_03G034430 [Hibiscus cannabinus]